MIDESEKRRIKYALMRAFKTFARQYYRDIFARVLEREGSADLAFVEAAVENDFLTLRATNPDSYMAIHDGRAKSKPVMKHRQVLVESAIRSIVKGGFGLSEIGRVRDGDKSEAHTERQRRRLVPEPYGAAFLESDIDHKRGDKGVARMSAAFSKFDPPPSPLGDVARAYMGAANIATSGTFHADMRRRGFFRSMIRLAFPRFLDDMMQFRGECRAVFEGLGERNEKADYLRDNLVEGADLLAVFYTHISSILDWVWFRTKSEDDQILLLKPAPKAKYRKQDAQRAREALTNIYGKKRAYGILDYCGKAFLHFGRPRAAAWLFAECANIGADDAEQGAMWQDVAVAYGAGRNYKSALGAMKKALPRLQAAGDPFNVCKALQVTGEFQWRLGFEKAARRSFEAAERQAAEVDEGKRWRVPFILAASFGRLGRTSLYRRYIAEALVAIPDDDPNAVLLVTRFANNEYLAYADGELPAALWRGINEILDENDAMVSGVDQNATQHGAGGEEASHADGRRAQRNGGDA